MPGASGQQRRLGRLFAVTCAAALVHGSIAAAPTRFVGPRETIVSHVMPAEQAEHKFIVLRFCYGSNRPTLDSRAVVRMFALARDVALASKAGGPDTQARWLGTSVPELSDAASRAAPFVGGDGLVTSSVQSFRNAALAELNRGQRSVFDVFPRPAENRVSLTRVIRVPKPGQTVTVSLHGCYSEDDLKNLLRARKRAADAFIGAASGLQ